MRRALCSSVASGLSGNDGIHSCRLRQRQRDKQTPAPELLVVPAHGANLCGGRSKTLPLRSSDADLVRRPSARGHPEDPRMPRHSLQTTTARPGAGARRSLFLVTVDRGRLRMLRRRSAGSPYPFASPCVAVVADAPEVARRLVAAGREFEPTLPPSPQLPKGLRSLSQSPEPRRRRAAVRVVNYGGWTLKIRSTWTPTASNFPRLHETEGAGTRADIRTPRKRVSTLPGHP